MRCQLVAKVDTYFLFSGYKILTLANTKDDYTILGLYKVDQI